MAATFVDARSIDTAVSRGDAPVVGDVPAVAASDPVVTADMSVRVAMAVNSSLDLRTVLYRLAEVAVEAIPSRATVFTLEGDALVPQVGFGQRAGPEMLVPFRSMGPIRLDGARASEYAERSPMVISDARRSELIPVDWVAAFDVRTIVLAPLFAADEACGLLALDWRHRRDVTPDELGLVRMIAEHAGLAIRNARIFEDEARHCRRLECLFQLSTASSTGASAERLVGQLNELLVDEGVDVTGLAFSDRRITRYFQTPRPTKAERRLWQNHAPQAALPDGGLGLPMRLGRRCVGSLRIAADEIDPDRREFLEAVAAGVAEVANRAAMRADAERAAQERAIGAERERLQADLHDTAGQTFAAIGLIANREAARPDSPADAPERFGRVAQLAEQGRAQLDEAVHSLAFAPTGRRRVVGSLRAFCRQVQNDSGVYVKFEVDGTIRRLPNRVEYALYRIGAEAVMNSWRHARASFVSVTVTKEADDITLEVVDDGIGLEARHDGSAHVGIDGMRRTATDVNGKLTLRHCEPRGVKVTLTVPLRGHRGNS